MNLEVLSKLLERPVELRPLPLSLAYPRGAVLSEAFKGALGAGGCFGVLGFMAPAAGMAWVLGAVGTFFLLYLARQGYRLAVRVRLDETGVIERRGGLEKALRWTEVEELRLGFYPNGRGAAAGTLVLSLRGAGGRLKHDSGLDQFPTLLAHAAAAGRERGLVLNETTLANLGQLGL